MSDTSPKSFSEYAKNRQPGVQSQPLFNFPAPTEPLKSSPGNRGFLAGFVDALNRGVYSLTEPISSLLDLPKDIERIQQTARTGDTAGAMKDAFGVYVKNLTSPARGALHGLVPGIEYSPEDRITWEGVIEKGVDTYYRNNPNYVDVENNVDPKVRGALGFVGDVVLDPINLIPGVWAAKAAAKASKEVATVGADVAEAGVRAAEKGTSVVEEAARVQAKKAPKTAAKDQFVQDGEAAVPKGKAVSSESFPVAEANEAIAKKLAAEPDNINAPSQVVRELLQKKKIRVGRKNEPLSGEFTKLFERLATITPAAVKVAYKPFNKWAAEFGQSVSAKAFTAQTINLRPFKFIASRMGGNTTSMKALLSFYENSIKNKDFAMVREIENQILKPMHKRYVERAKTGKPVDAVGNFIKASDTVVNDIQENVNLTIARQLKEAEGETLEIAMKVFGEDLFKEARRLSVNSLAKLIDSIKLALDEAGTLPTFGTIKKARSEFLRRFSIDEKMYQAALDDAAGKAMDIPTVTPESLADDLTAISESIDAGTDAEQILRNLGYLPSDTRALAPEQLAPIVLKLVEDTLKYGGKDKPGPIFEKMDLDVINGKHDFITDDGTFRTAGVYGEGTGVKALAANTHFFLDVILSLQRNLVKLLEIGKAPDVLAGATRGFIRGAEAERLHLASMKLIEKLFDEHGLTMHFDVQFLGDAAKEVVSLRWTDAYDVVKAYLGNDKILQLLFHNNIKSTLPYTKFMDAVAATVVKKDLPEDELRMLIDDILKSTERRNPVLDSADNSRTKPIPNFLAEDDSWFKYGVGKAGNFGDGVRQAGKALEWNSGVAREKLVDAIYNAREDLAQVATNRQLAIKARGQAEGEVLSDIYAGIFLDIAADATKLAEQLNIVAKDGRVIRDIQESMDKVSPLGSKIAMLRVNAALGYGYKRNAETTVDLADKVAKGKKEDIVKGREESLKAADEQVEAIEKNTEDLLNAANDGQRGFDPDTPQKFIDNAYDEMGEARFNLNRFLEGEGYKNIKVATIKFLEPLNKFFNARAGMHSRNQLWIHSLFRTKETLPLYLQHKYLMPLDALSKKFAGVIEDGSTTIIQEAFKHVKNPALGVPKNPMVKEAYEALSTHFGRVFNISDNPINDLLGNTFFRTGAGVAYLNMLFKSKAVLGRTKSTVVTATEDGFFDLNKGLADAAKIAQDAGRPLTNEDILKATLNQWKEWDIQDPVDFMKGVYNAAIQASAEVGYVTKFRQKALQSGVGSAEKVKGWVKISATGDGRLDQLVETEFWVHPDIAEAWDAVNRVVGSSTRLNGEVGQLVSKILDPFTEAWKYAVTVARLGHHVRNFVGGITMTYLAQGLKYAAESHRAAWRFMREGGRNYTDVDVVRALGYLEEPLVTVKSGRQFGIKSKNFGTITEDEIAEAMLRYGVLPPAKSAQALYKSEAIGEELIETKASRFLEKFFGIASLGTALRGGKWERAWTTLSEGQDHYSRIQHFLQYIRQAQDGEPMARTFGVTVTPKSKEELFEFAAERVGKFHPDLMTMSVGEKTFARRLYSFYHWNKGAVQAVLETAVMAPHRIQLPNKASYNLAVAMGLDPHSMYDPFPVDQRFPSFLTEEQQGPTFEINGKYYGVRPGIASWDVINQFGGGIDEAFFDGLNPAFKLPIELATGTRLGSQSRIRDMSEYIDSSIPGAGYVSNVSSYSVTGSLLGLLTGSGLDRQFQYESGNKNVWDQALSFSNWLTGFGITPYSRSSYVNLAKIEEQLRRAEEREKNQ